METKELIAIKGYIEIRRRVTEDLLKYRHQPEDVKERDLVDKIIWDILNKEVRHDEKV